MRRIIIFDTTLRDGEQSPGASLNRAEKVEIARQLARLGVDVIEAGFPIASPDDFEAVRAVANEVRDVIVCGLARTLDADIERAAASLEKAAKPRLHVFCATSAIHRQFKLRKAKEEIIRMTVEGVRKARQYVDDVEFSPEDATRTEPDFLAQVVAAAIDAGATTINIPDTVGYAVPEQFTELIGYLLKNVPNIPKAAISVHCHNDLGLAVANSLAAVKAGAAQVECTINGLGERAGNAALEEVVMALRTRADYFNCTTGIDTRRILATSRLVSSLTGLHVQRNKAIVGENAFAHEAGIHQDGVLKERTTYEIMRPEDVGFSASQFVLGKHSGRHAFRERVRALGYNLTDEQLESAFARFKQLADRKKEVFDDDIEALIEEELAVTVAKEFVLESLHTSSGTTTTPTATVRLRRADGEVIEDAAIGDGPVDATYRTIERITGISARLTDYRIRAVTSGKEALGEVSLEIESEGQRVRGRAISTDIIEGSAIAYLKAINRLISLRRAGGKKDQRAPSP